VYLVAAGLIVIAQLAITATLRPRPTSLLEAAYVLAPAAAVVALLVLAWRSLGA